MGDNDKKQKTAKGEEIPVPKREDFMENLKKVAPKDDPDSTTDDAEEK